MSKAKTPRPTLALTIKHPGGGETEIHLLNPGEAFPNFGGSKHACVAGKTASIITRVKNVGVSDYERNIFDPSFWEWIAKLINNKGEYEVTAVTPETESKVDA